MIVHEKSDFDSENNGAKDAKSSGYAMDDDELGLSVSFKKEEEEDLEESVRLQGKNGVLMENKHKSMGLSHRDNIENLDGERLSLSHNIHGAKKKKREQQCNQSQMHLRVIRKARLRKLISLKSNC